MVKRERGESEQEVGSGVYAKMATVETTVKIDAMTAPIWIDAEEEAPPVWFEDEAAALLLAFEPEAAAT